MTIRSPYPTTPSEADSKAKALVAAEAAKRVKRTVTELVNGKDDAGKPAKVARTKQVTVAADEGLSHRDSARTLFFVDPPYLPMTRSKHGYRCELTQERHVELLEALNNVAGLVVLAGYPSDLYNRMLTDWRRVERQHFAAGSRTPRREVLWISQKAARALDLAPKRA